MCDYAASARHLRNRLGYGVPMCHVQETLCLFTVTDEKVENTSRFELRVLCKNRQRRRRLRSKQNNEKNQMHFYAMQCVCVCSCATAGATVLIIIASRRRRRFGALFVLLSFIQFVVVVVTSGSDPAQAFAYCRCYFCALFFNFVVSVDAAAEPEHRTQSRERER